MPRGRKKKFVDPDDPLRYDLSIEEWDRLILGIGDSGECDCEDDAIGEGCAACGNPNYPKCKAGCPMFDI